MREFHSFMPRQNAQEESKLSTVRDRAVREGFVVQTSVCLFPCFSTLLLLSLEGGEINSNKVEMKEAN
jgi:hypothetical protein